MTKYESEGTPSSHNNLQMLFHRAMISGGRALGMAKWCEVTICYCTSLYVSYPRLHASNTYKLHIQFICSIILKVTATYHNSHTGPESRASSSSSSGFCLGGFQRSGTNFTASQVSLSGSLRALMIKLVALGSTSTLAWRFLVSSIFSRL